MGRKSRQKMTGMAEEERVKRAKLRKGFSLRVNVDAKTLDTLLRTDEEFKRRIIEMIEAYNAGKLDIERIKEEVEKHAKQTPNI